MGKIHTLTSSSGKMNLLTSRPETLEALTAYDNIWSRLYDVCYTIRFEHEDKSVVIKSFAGQ
jgi:hypothetical protein